MAVKKTKDMFASRADTQRQLHDKTATEILQLVARGLIASGKDLYGDAGPSALFPLLLRRYKNLFEPGDRSSFTSRQVRVRSPFSRLVRSIGPFTYKTKQVMEDLGELDGTGRKVAMPNGPVMRAW